MLRETVLVVDLEKKEYSSKGLGEKILQKTKFISQAARKMQPMNNFTFY